MELDEGLKEALRDDDKIFDEAYMPRHLTQSDIEAISTIASLEKVSFIGGEVESYAPLAKLPNLKRLAINHGSSSDLTSVGAITQLRELSLSENEQYRDLNFLTNLCNLEILDLTDGQFSDLSPVRNLPKLRVLKLMNCDELSDISALSDLPMLEDLDLNSTGVEDLSPIAGLANLKRLDVRGAEEIEDYDVVDQLNLGDGFITD